MAYLKKKSGQLNEREQRFIQWAHFLGAKGFVPGKNGNISQRYALNRIMITSHGAYLGQLSLNNIIVTDVRGRCIGKKAVLTSEKDIHYAIYHAFDDIHVVAHVHPLFTTAFFHWYQDIEFFSYEAKFYIGTVVCIPQQGPWITDLDRVVRALSLNNIVVLKNHGVISIGSTFEDAVGQVELLEGQAKINFLRRSGKEEYLIRNKTVGERNKESGRSPVKLFSRQFKSAVITQLANDSQLKLLGEDLTVTILVTCAPPDGREILCCQYTKGKCKQGDCTCGADVEVQGADIVFYQVIKGERDIFSAYAQGKITFKGNVALVRKQFPFFKRFFELWKNVPVKMCAHD